jgi:hypothetical protein
VRRSASPASSCSTWDPVEASGWTTLQSGSVVSTSTGNLASLSLVNGLVSVSVLSDPLLTATSDGTTGTVTANDYAVSVTFGGVTTELHAGGSRSINVTIPFVGSVALTITVGALNDTSAGATGSGDLTFLQISGAISGPTGGSLGSFDYNLLR